MLDDLQLFWEEQHPSVRANLSMGIGALLLSLILRAVIWVGVRNFDLNQMFTLMFVLRLLQTILILLIVVALYNVMRLTIQFLRGRGVATGVGITMAWAGAVLIGVTYLTLPGVLDAVISYRSGRAYDAVYQEVDTLCDQWLDEWEQATSISLNTTDGSLGWIGQHAQVYRVRNSILFDFSDPLVMPRRSYGLACVLDGEAPADSGRANNFTFYRQADAIYQFLEEQD